MKQARGLALGRLARAVTVLVVAATLLPGVSAASTPRNGSAGVGLTPRAVSSCGVVANARMRITSQPPPCTVTIELGARIGISLKRGFQWGNPQSSSRAVRATGVSHPTAGGLTATLQATALGRATVTSTGTIICPPGQACPMLALLWSLHVIVVRHLSESQTIAVTQDDSARRFTLHHGDRLVIRLTGPTFYTWTAPASADPSVLRRLMATTASTASASFIAKAPGTARVTAVDNPNCYPQCLPPSRLFQVSVTVIG